MRSIILAGMLCLTMLLGLSFNVHAQTQNISVSTTVLSPISISSVSNLDLGFVLAGAGEQGFLAADPEAGSNTISKSNLNGLTMDVQYPSTLSGPSGATLSLIFNGSSYGSYTPTEGSAVSFNPSSPGSSLTNILQNATGATFKFGAKVNPALGQTVGSYSGQIVIVMAYAALF